MTTSVRFCLSYYMYHLQWDFIAFKMNNISKRKHNVDKNVANDVTSARRSVITRVTILFFYDMTTINVYFFPSLIINFCFRIRIWSVTVSVPDQCLLVFFV